MAIQCTYAEAKLARQDGWFSRRHQSRTAHDSAREKWDAEHPHRTISFRDAKRRRQQDRCISAKKAS